MRGQATNYNPAAVAITGGSIGGMTSGLPLVLAKNGIPIIGLSSGSVAAGGGISAITALPFACPNAYCYFPALALSGSSVAGFYYCTFASTTTGTAFLDRWTTGLPTVPSSPTPVVAGAGAFTGDTGEEFMPGIALSANPGVNFAMDICSTWTATNTAGAKNGRIRWSGNAGSVLGNPLLTTTLTTHQFNKIKNRGVANAQSQSQYAMVAANALVTTQQNYLAIDTTAATTVVFSLQRAAATDNICLESFDVLVSY